MITFAYPKLLWLLLLLPVLALLFRLMRLQRSLRLRRFGRPELLEPLMPEASRYMPWVKLGISLAVTGLLVIVLARPRTTQSLDSLASEQTQTRGVEVMVCLDVSNSMLASATDDPSGVSRLDRAKHLLEQLIKTLNNDRVGLIVFAGNAYTQLPVTNDYVSARMFINSVSTTMVPSQGTAIGAAIDMACDAFTPDPKVGKAIIIITDGENFEDDAVASARRAAESGIQVDVIGMGSGEPMPIPYGEGISGYLIDPETGSEVRTALDAQQAQAIAEAGGGVYVNGATTGAIREVDKALDSLAQTTFVRTTFSPRSEQFPLFAWLALILVLVNLFTVTRKISWLRRFTFFTRK